MSGFSIVFLYSVIKITKGKSWHCFIRQGSKRDFLHFCIIAILLLLGQVHYGAGTYYLGNLGTSVGWAVYISLSVVVANVFGFLRGEWNLSSHGAAIALIGGIIMLVAEVIVIAWGNSISMGVA